MEQIDIAGSRTALRDLAHRILNAPGEHVEVTVYAKNNNAMHEEVAVVFTNDDMQGGDRADDEYIVDVS